MFFSTSIGHRLRLFPKYTRKVKCLPNIEARFGSDPMFTWTAWSTIFIFPGCSVNGGVRLLNVILWMLA